MLRMVGSSNRQLSSGFDRRATTARAPRDFSGRSAPGKSCDWCQCSIALAIVGREQFNRVAISSQALTRVVHLHRLLGQLHESRRLQVLLVQGRAAGPAVGSGQPSPLEPGVQGLGGPVPRDAELGGDGLDQLPPVVELLDAVGAGFAGGRFAVIDRDDRLLRVLLAGRRRRASGPSRRASAPGTAPGASRVGPGLAALDQLDPAAGQQVDDLTNLARFLRVLSTPRRGQDRLEAGQEFADFGFRRDDSGAGPGGLQGAISASSPARRWRSSRSSTADSFRSVSVSPGLFRMKSICRPSALLRDLRPFSRFGSGRWRSSAWRRQASMTAATSCES